MIILLENKEILINFINNEISTIPISLNDKISRNNNKFLHRDEFFEIKNLIDDFIENETYNRYLVLPGLRGVGKTTILYQLYDYLLKEKDISQNQILYISCENLNERFKFKILEVLECFLKYHHNSTLRTLDKKIFLFIDESQYDYNWALSGKIIYDSSNKIFMIFTGSSALNLEYNADSARRLLKRNVTPLNFRQYLMLKYNFSHEKISDALTDLIFKGEVEKAMEYEREINSSIYNIEGFSDNEWNDFLHYGGFPLSFYEKNLNYTSSRLKDIVRKVVMSDMNTIGSISSESQINTIRLLNFLALQKPGDVSQNKIANYLDTSSSNIKNILDVLEKTHLLFHTEPYGSASKRSKKSWNYYFATSSLRHSLVMDLGNAFRDSNAYRGILLENFVASSFFNLAIGGNRQLSLFYDDNEKRNVDFIIQEGFDNPIPIEVGIGKKNKKQIKNAMNRYDSDYGIVISNSTMSIEKDEDVIFISPRTFSFM